MINDPIYVIGDIHGCTQEIIELVNDINLNAEQKQLDEYKVIFVGDYVDRGEDSCGTVDFVKSLTELYPEKYIALMGNHDSMAAEGMVYDWERNYGYKTLNSYPDRKIYPEHLVWLKERPLGVAINNVAITHADLDPYSTIDNVIEDVALWSRMIDDTLHSVYKYRVHGHTPMVNPKIGENRAFIDTGCVFDQGRKLTALFIPDTVEPRKLDMELLYVRRK